MMYCYRVAAFALATAAPAAVSSQTGWSKPHAELHVAPAGDDAATGSESAPFATLARAQAAVRALNADHDVTVIVHGGTYALTKPLTFTARDGGRNGFAVTWRGAAGERPVLSGGMAVTRWRPFDAARGIYVADVPKGTEARHLWVNRRLASRARTEIARGDASFDERGIALAGASARTLAAAGQAPRMEVEATGFFTDRFSPVERVVGSRLDMRQPAWNNNIWGYDTLPHPYQPEQSHLFLANALAFLNEAREWYLDPVAGRLYYKPAAGETIEDADVRLPRLELLISIAGTPQAPVQDLSISGLQFSYTSWLGPSSAEGYASQQSGTFLTGRAAAYPANVLVTCRTGCPAFETMRNTWHQMPAAVQIAAAQHVKVDGNIFAHLGEYALGIGQDANANASGVGLAVVDAVVSNNLFTDLAGGAIMAGGVRPDAHHPSDPRLTNRQLMIRSNLIQGVGRDFKDNSAILATYWDGAIILHNDVSDGPYDAIDIGFGWGYVDRGGNPNYRARQRGYDGGINPVWETPTIRHDNVVAFNRVYGVKRLADDGGAIYNLSACPDCVIAENHVFDIGHRVALYLDEGSRGFTVRNNVVEGPVRQWLNVNTARSALPIRTSVNNTATGNWHQATTVGGIWNAYMNNRIEDDHVVINNAWPGAARQVMGNAGLEADNTVPAYGDVRARPKEGLPPPQPKGSGTFDENDPKGVQNRPDPDD